MPKFIYYLACVLLWLGLTILALLSLSNRFYDYLTRHPKFTLYLLGINIVPAVADLKKFYLFLAGGWTWLLVWSWWLMPWLKEYFFKTVSNPPTLQIARISSLVVIVSYTGVGFFFIGKSLTIWFKKIYRNAKI